MSKKSDSISEKMINSAAIKETRPNTLTLSPAPQVAKDRGVNVEVVTREQQGAYENYIRLTVVTERQERAVAGTVFANGKPRIIQVKGINMDARLYFAPASMLKGAAHGLP